MKQRRTVVLAFLLIAAMALGVGYAALSDQLTMTGTATVGRVAADAEFDEDIYILSATALGDGTPNTASLVPTNNNKATFTVNSLSLEGETAQFSFVIANAGDHEAAVSIAGMSISDYNTADAVKDNDDDGYFSIATDWTDNKSTLPAATDAEHPGTVTLTITITLEKPITIETGADFTIEVSAVVADTEA